MKLPPGCRLTFEDHPDESDADFLGLALDDYNRGCFGETGYARDFIGYWIDWLIFYSAPPWVFTAVYLTFGMLVLLTLWFVPVRWPKSLSQMRRY